MAAIDVRYLDAALAQVEEARHWSPRLVSRLETLLRSDDDQQLVHINPIAFAKEHGIAESEAIDLFLHAAKAGLFRMDWSMICFGCGFRIESFDSLRDVRARGRCNVCQAEREANLDDWIEVSFTVLPAVRRILFHDLNALTAEQYYQGYLLYRAFHLPDGQGAVSFTRSIMQLCERLEPQTELRRDVAAVPGGLQCTVSSHRTDLAFEVTAEPAATQELTIQLRRGGAIASLDRLKSGPLRVNIQNDTEIPAYVFTVMVSHDLNWSPPIFDPFLTGSVLLANQTFRKLFRNEVIQASDGIGVRFVTLLFTDLKGSTALYERIGDLKAFTLVRQHFERIDAAVQAHSGAMVKTIGDAVMAVFVDPAQAVAAAQEMIRTIRQFNAEQGSKDLVLKIGLHTGPSIAVTLNHNLDYFGQTVNIAARVQGLADADEIWITDSVYSAKGVRELAGELSPQNVQLKGIEQDVRVYRLDSPRA